MWIGLNNFGEREFIGGIESLKLNLLFVRTTANTAPPLTFEKRGRLKMPSNKTRTFTPWFIVLAKAGISSDPLFNESCNDGGDPKE
jgi:hypothetical protein